jgi:hypothetical protein
MSGRRRGAWWAVGVFVVVAGVYLDSKVATSYDSKWSLHQALSLLHEGDLDLDEYRGVIPADEYRVEEVDGRLRSVFPVGGVLLATPLVGVAEAASGGELGERLRAAPPDWPARKLEKTVASLLVAAAALFLFLAARRRGLSAAQAAVAALGFAFATSAWSTASRGLWQHGPLMLLFAMALWLLARAEERPAAAAWSALPLAFAYLVRPTAAIPLAVFALVIAVRHPRRLVLWLALAAAVLLPFALWSHGVYGTWLPPYYASERLALHDRFGEALAAHLVSPARGLLVYSPWLVAALVGPFVSSAGRRRPGAVEVGCLASAAGIWLAASAFGHWWGGHAYGPRLLADAVPFLVYLALPVLPALWPRGRRAPLADEAAGRRRRPLAAVAAGLLLAALAWSLFAHGRAARSWEPWTWNGEPVDVDRHPRRIWDWSDPPFLRGIADDGAAAAPVGG